MTERGTNGFWAFLRVFGRGINMVRLVILNLVFFAFFGLFLLLLLAFWAGSHMELGIQNDTVLVLKPQGELVEQFSIEPLERAVQSLSGNAPKQVQVRDLVGAIDAATTDNRISRILLEPQDLHGGGFASLREVADALDRFRAAGKPVVVWAASMDQGQYYLAAHADRILLDPMGGVVLTGLANYRLFYKDLLDRLAWTCTCSASASSRARPSRTSSTTPRPNRRKPTPTGWAACGTATSMRWPSCASSSRPRCAPPSTACRRRSPAPRATSASWPSTNTWSTAWPRATTSRT